MFEDLFYPDNPKRKRRVAELGADTQNYLREAKETYDLYKALLQQANQQIALVYQKAGLSPPPTSQIDLLQTQKALYRFDTEETLLQGVDITLDVAGVALSSLFAPGAAAFLAEIGVLSEEMAATVLASVLELDFTLGAIAGGILAAVVVGAAIVSIEAVIDAIEGGKERKALREGIVQTFKIRNNTRISLDKSQVAVNALQAIVDTCNTLLKSDINMTDQQIRVLIAKDVAPSVQTLKAITSITVYQELNQMDLSRRSWMAEDPSRSLA